MNDIENKDSISENSDKGSNKKWIRKSLVERRSLLSTNIYNKLRNLKKEKFH